MSSSAHARKLVLIERMPNGSLRKIPLTDAARWGAKAGAQYAVIDEASGAAPKGLVLKRQGQSLVIDLQEQAEQVTIAQFYDEPGATFLPQGSLAGDALTGTAITASSPAVGSAASGEPLIWSATSESGGITPLQFGLGGLGVAALAAGGGGGGSDSAPAKPPAAVVNTVQGTVVGGPVVPGNGLTVMIYQADGVTKLGEAKVNADGSFTVSVGSYQGVIIAKVEDSDSGADYLDEATESGKDLNAELFSMEVITTPNSTVVVNLNVLTTLAYSKALEAASDAPFSAEAVTTTNMAIAELFGLQNLQSTAVTTTNGGSFEAGDGLSQGETYGAVLAALSGADDANGGDSQQTLDALLAGITLGVGGATLSQAAQDIVIEGAALTSSQTGTDLTGSVATIVDTHAPTITSGSTATAINENSNAGQVVYTAAATDPAPVIYSLKAGGDAALLSINTSTGAVTLTGSPDHETQASYSFTVVATDAAGNASEQAVTLAINDLDDTAPAFTSGATATAIDENSGASQVVYTATSTDNADVVAGSTSYSLKAGGDAALFSINASTGAVTLTGNPNHEAKASYSFTVVATDAAGNASEQAVTLGINDLDDTAPTITSGTTATAINENSGASQVVYTAASTDNADVVSGSTSYSLKAGGDAALFSINASTGAVTLTGNPDHEAKASYAFTVVATDAAGNASEQAVSLGINDLDESAPTFTSGATATAINENSGAAQVVYTATSTDSADVATGSTSYSLKAGADAALFSINASTGAVTLTGNPDHEAKTSYSFTVVATDAAGNFSEQAVILGINDLDESAPTITSGAMATAINENSGAGQVVYTATSTDAGDVSTGSTSYSLKAGGDAALFSINTSTGAVSLTGNPDFETKASYNFTVVATDAAGNASEQAITLAINDLADETAPTVSTIALSGASGPFNAGDTLSVTVTMDEATVVNTGGGTPRVALSMGASTVYATYASGSNSTSLVFNYTVQSGDTDANGVSIGANALQLNGGTLRDAAGNAASLSHAAVGDSSNHVVDTTTPSITSSATATAINENSGAGQVVYTAAATDASALSYSLKAVGDQASFSINPSSGAVTLTGNPDFEAKANYSFTVVATDAAGNASERAVTLAINDVDDVAPTVSSVAISGASGAQNSRLNAGDVVSVTVNMSEATTVTGTPQVALNIGGATVYASYVSGSSGTALLFQYTVQPGDTDSDGISIGANALQLSTGTLQDAAGNNATLTHSGVANDASYRVDTAGPTLSVSTPSDNATAVGVSNDIVLYFNETVQAGSGNIVISNGAGDVRTIWVMDTSQVTVSFNTVVINPTNDLISGNNYNVQMTSGVLKDLAGNDYAGISSNTTLNFATAASQTASSDIVVFDLVEGVSSDHSGRTFDANTAYTIYIRVNSTSGALSTDGDGPGANDSWGQWSGANNLGSDDRIVLVGNGSQIKGPSGGNVDRHFPDGTKSQWVSNSASLAAYLGSTGLVSRLDNAGGTDSTRLWNGPWAANPNNGRAFASVYQTAMPAGILTSQGLQ